MTEEKMTYTEVVRLLLTRIKSLDEKFNKLDSRELILQKAFERLLGTLEGKKEASSSTRYNATLVLSIIALIASIVISVVGWVFK